MIQGSTPVKRIEAVLEYVRTHVDEEMSIPVLAARAGFSPFHFQRIFRLAVGQTIGEYIRGRRLQRAAIDLRTSEKPVSLIALESGYETASAFTRAFSHLYGVAPAAFRGAEASVHVAGAMTYTLRRFPKLRMLGMRHIGPYSQVSAMWPRFIEEVSARGLLVNAQRVGLSYDDPDAVALSSLRYDACIVTDADAAPPLFERNVEAGVFAVYRYVGTYALIGHTFDRFVDQLVCREGFDLRDAPCMELYQNDHAASDPRDCITDLAVPVV